MSRNYADPKVKEWVEKYGNSDTHGNRHTIFSALQRLPEKAIKGIMKLTEMENVVKDILLATLSVPDEKLNEYIQTKLKPIIDRIAVLFRESFEGVGGDLISTFGRAFPFANMTYVIGDLVRAQEKVNNIKGKGAEMLQDVVNQFRDLYSDIAGPSKGFVALLLSMASIIERIQDKIKNGEPLTEKDTAVLKSLETVGKHLDTTDPNSVPITIGLAEKIKEIASTTDEKNPSSSRVAHGMEQKAIHSTGLPTNIPDSRIFSFIPTSKSEGEKTSVPQGGRARKRKHRKIKHVTRTQFTRRITKPKTHSSKSRRKKPSSSSRHYRKDSKKTKYY